MYAPVPAPLLHDEDDNLYEASTTREVSMDNEDLSFAIDHLELKQEEGDDGDFICKFTAHTWETDDDEDFVDGEVSMESEDHPDKNYDTELECGEFHSGACSPSDDDEVCVDGAHVHLTREVSMESEDHPDANYDTELECGELYSVACSPTDATLVATGGCDNRGFLWKIGEVNQPFKLQGHKDSVASLAFSYDGQLLASGCLDGIVKVWDLHGNLEGKKLEGPGPRKGIEWLRWHPRGHILLAGSQDFTVWMWNTDKASLLNTFIGHGGSVTCGDFTPDGKRICTGSDDATMRIWNPKSGESIHVVRGYPYHTEGLTCMAICSTSTLALTGSLDGSVHIVNVSTGRVVDNNALVSHSDSVECVGFAPSDSWAAVGGKDKKLVIWDIEHLLPRSICKHECGVSCLAWLGAYVATGCVDGKVRLWDSRSGECVKTFKGHSGNIAALSVSADGSYLVSASHDETACVFEVGNFL